MISQLMLMMMSFNLQARMVTPPAKEVPEYAKDGTPIGGLLAFEDVKSMSPRDFADYMNNIKIIMVHYEEHLGQYLTDPETAVLFRKMRPFMSLILSDEANAVDGVTAETPQQKRRRLEREATLRTGSNATPIQDDESISASAGAETAQEKRRRLEREAVMSSGSNATPIKEDSPSPAGAATGAAGTTAASDGSKCGSDKPAFRCLYAGWPVTTDKCKPPPEASGTTIKIGDKSVKLQCSQSQTMCNPMAFGVISNGGGTKPVCVSVGGDRRNTTRQCYFASNEAKAKLSQSDFAANKDKYDKFQQAFNLLCNGDGVSNNKYFCKRPRAQKDMQDTCAWIKSRNVLVNAGGDSVKVNAKSKTWYNPNRQDSKTDSRRNEGSDSAK